jgi:hypothetical protein
VKRKRVALFVMIDALGAEHLRTREFLPELPYRAALRTVLGFSCSCQPTLLSGKLPAQHGHGAMYMLRDGPSGLDAARPWAWLPSWVAQNHRVRRRIEASVARTVRGYFSLYEVPTRLLPRFDLVEHRSIFAPGGLRRARSIFDRLVELGLRWTCYDWRSPEEASLRAVEGDLISGQVDFVFLYLYALDGLLHAQGSLGDDVGRHLRWYEERLRRLFTVAHDSAEAVEAFIFSDHGMSDVHGAVDLKAEVERKLGENGRRYLAFYDSTMARFWAEDPAVLAAIGDVLARHGQGRIIPDDELEQLGGRFPDRSQGDLIYVLGEGLLILPSYMGSSRLAAMHGYHPDAKGADACLIGLRDPDETLRHIRDLYALMERSALRVHQELA